jgi:hypothetical protein
MMHEAHKKYFKRHLHGIIIDAGLFTLSLALIMPALIAFGGLVL